jgi:hypothetical protein
VTLTETQRKAAINSLFQNGYDACALEDSLEVQPRRFLLLGITADSYDSVIWVTSQFSRHMNGWWLNRKVQAAIPSTYDQLVAELRKTTILPNIQGDAINALLNFTQSNTMSYVVYVKQFNDFLRRSRQNLIQPMYSAYALLMAWQTFPRRPKLSHTCRKRVILSLLWSYRIF